LPIKKKLYSDQQSSYQDYSLNDGAYDLLSNNALTNIKKKAAKIVSTKK